MKYNSPVEQLLDEENFEPITIVNNDGKAISFEQVAILPFEGIQYAILKPVEKMANVDNDQALVFVLDIESDSLKILASKSEEDDAKVERIIDEVFKIYEKMYDESKD